MKSGHIRYTWDVGRRKLVILLQTILYHSICFNKHAIIFVIQVTIFAVYKRKIEFSKWLLFWPPHGLGT